MSPVLCAFLFSLEPNIIIWLNTSYSTLHLIFHWYFEFNNYLITSRLGLDNDINNTNSQ